VRFVVVVFSGGELKIIELKNQTIATSGALKQPIPINKLFLSFLYKSSEV
jgi:hypothetical protein